MMIVRYAPIVTEGEIPPFGSALKEHILAVKNKSAYAESLSAWRLLYSTLTENNLSPGEVAFESGGKPYFKDSPVYFSLSHSGGLCAVAVSDRPCGVDIEKVRPYYKDSLVSKCLSENEKIEYDGDFASLWCKKEAYAKLTGEGILTYPSNIDTLLCGCKFELMRFFYEESAYVIAAAAK